MQDNQEQKTNMLVWFFGRGASIANGLDWVEPENWQSLDRDIRIQKIKETLRFEMQKIPAKIGPYSELLSILEKDTLPHWRHLFITTNWDYLLQREILESKSKILPSWLVDSQVFHLNGSVEQGSQENRSPFLLETDPFQLRKNSLETNRAVNYMIWERLFVIVGVSFKCEMDKALLIYLRSIEDQLPFGEAHWVILDPEKISLDNTCACFKKFFPAANIIPVNIRFENWVRGSLSELIQFEVIRSQERVIA